MLDELVRLGAGVDQRPGEVAVRARSLLESACRRGSGREAAVGATLLARAQRNLGEVEAAAWAIGRALEHGAEIGGRVLADAHLVAASIVTFRRSDEEAMRHLDEAERYGDREMRIQVALQRAVLAKRAGRLDEAIEIYRTVLPELLRAGDAITTARVLSNRGSIMVLRGRVDDALRDFEHARSLFEDAGQDLGIAIVTENIAWAHVTRGDIPAALALLDAAAETAERLGHQLQDAAISRAEALMAAGLFGDASDVLSDVVRTLEATGDRAGTAEALLVHAEALRLAGRPSGTSARRAHELFVGLGASGFAAQAELEALRAAASDVLTDVVRMLVATSDRPGTGDAAPVHTRACDGAMELELGTTGANACTGGAELERAEQLAVDLESAGTARSAVDAWSLVTLLALRNGDLPRARAAALRCATRACAVPFVEHRLASAVARAAIEFAGGDDGRAMRVIERALADFERYRAEIGSPDARSGSAHHATELGALGATVVAMSNDPGRILAWTERRRRAVPAWLPAAPDDSPPVPHGTAAELRSVTAELRAAELAGAAPSGRDVDELVRRRAALEREQRDRLLTIERRARVDAAAGMPPEFDQGERVGVSIDVHGDRLLAVVCTGHRRRLVDLGPVAPIVATVQSAQSATTGLARAEACNGATDRALSRMLAAAARFADLAITPLRLPSGPLVLSVPTELQSAPWTSTADVRSTPVSMVSSLGGFRGADSPVRATVGTVAGPRLRFAESEAVRVAAIHRGASARTGAAATVATVRSDLESCDLVHIAAHTRVRSDNAMWSTVELADGPLHLHEIASCDRVPEVVVLSSCGSATACAANGLPGLARALLEMGSRAVIASTSELADTTSTVDVVATMHRALATGVAPADALAAARGEHPTAPAAHALVCWER